MRATRAKRVFVLVVSAVSLVATGTAVAVTNFGLLHANDRPSPAGSLELRTVQQDAGAAQAAETEAARVDLQGGVIHVFRPDGSEVTLPLPAADTAVPSHDGDGDDSSSPTTRARAPSPEGRHDDDD